MPPALTPAVAAHVLIARALAAAGRDPCPSGRLYFILRTGGPALAHPCGCPGAPDNGWSKARFRDALRERDLPRGSALVEWAGTASGAVRFTRRGADARAKLGGGGGGGGGGGASPPPAEVAAEAASAAKKRAKTGGRV